MRQGSVLVLRRADAFGRELAAAGLDVSNVELIKTEDVENLPVLDAAIAKIDSYDCAIFTSPAAAAAFVRRFENKRRVSKTTVYALGRRARSVLEAAGFRVKYFPAAATAEDLIDAAGIELFRGKNVLYARGNLSSGVVAGKLSDVAARLDEVEVYQTVPVEVPGDVIRDIALAIRNKRILLSCFFSPSAVSRFVLLFGGDVFAALRTAAIGRTTAAALSEAGSRPEVVAARPERRVFAAAVVEFIKNCE